MNLRDGARGLVFLYGSLRPMEVPEPATSQAVLDAGLCIDYTHTELFPLDHRSLFLAKTVSRVRFSSFFSKCGQLCWCQRR
jgi:hypothetical protein